MIRKTLLMKWELEFSPLYLIFCQTSIKRGLGVHERHATRHREFLFDKEKSEKQAYAQCRLRHGYAPERKWGRKQRQK